MCRYDGAGRKTAKDKDFFVEKDYRGYISRKISEEAEAVEEVKQLFEAVSLRGFHYL